MIVSLAVFLVVVLVLAIAGLALISGAGSKRPGRGTSNLNKALVQDKWTAIEMTANSGAAGLKQAINDADKLLDYVLKGLGLPGDTLADRLRRGESRLSDKNAVWRAHKLRNSLAHDIGFDLVQSQAREALRDFRRGLQDLGAL